MGGSKKKVGKARRDKFYHLAKETGYRARSAFKLIQLNRKYGFLEKSRVCIDLCAAPGGWCQVAANHMPVSSVIVGVDLVPIKPIPKVTTLVDDITSDKCRSDLKKELRDSKADVVLNDGAPNVGQNWLQDAFSQAGLTLHALKLASEFLRKGGWFVTKVFRSQDYHALLWVFRQLFHKVHSTKPQASRSESAEIFVVCQGYVAPDKLDPKFLDPKAVFKDVNDEPENRLNLLQPASKKKKKAEGYKEGDYTQHTKLSVTDFINDPKYMDRLALASELVVDKEEYKKHSSTTPEVLECCKDIKILGKADIKLLIYWRKQLAKTLKELESAETGEQEVEGEESGEKKAESEEEENEIDNEVSRLRAEIEQDAKRKKKKAGKVKAKLREKMRLNIIRPGDRIEQQDDESLFDLKRMKTKEHLDRVESFAVEGAEPELEWESDDSESDSGRKRNVMYDRTEGNVDAWSDDEVEEGESDVDMDDVSAPEGSDSDNEEQEGAVSNPLLADLNTSEEHLSKQAKLWFKREAFEGVDLDEDEDYDVDQMITQYQQKGGKVRGAKADEDNTGLDSDVAVKKKNPKSAKLSVSNLASDGQSDEEDYDEEDDDEHDSDESDYEQLYDRKKYKNGKVVDDANGEMEVVKAEEPVPKLDAVGLALGAKLISSRKARRQMIDDSFNRYAFHDDSLPDWFERDEKRHNTRHIPVTKAEIQEYKEKLKAINARPIKKIAEAKGRKKRKMMKRLEKARKKAESLEGTDGDGVSEKEKWQQIKSIYKKATRQKKVDTTYVVAKKGAGKKVSRPSGVKGRFKVVDPRLKKDNRNAKSMNNKKGKGSKPQRGKQTKGKKR